MFTESDRFSSFPPGRLLWLLRRKPKLFYLLCCAWVAGVFGGSKFRHVAISDGSVVVNYEFLRRYYYSHEDFVKSFEILGYVEIDSDRALDLRVLSGIERTRWIVPLTAQFLLMGFSRGFYQVDNCTISAKQALWGAGVEVPDRSIWCPTKLLLWLMENENDFTAGPPPSDSRETDRGVGQDECPSEGGLSSDQC